MASKTPTVARIGNILAGECWSVAGAAGCWAATDAAAVQPSAPAQQLTGSMEAVRRCMTGQREQQLLQAALAAAAHACGAPPPARRSQASCCWASACLLCCWPAWSGERQGTCCRAAQAAMLADAGRSRMTTGDCAALGPLCCAQQQRPCMYVPQCCCPPLPSHPHPTLQALHGPRLGVCGVRGRHMLQPAGPAQLRPVAAPGPQVGAHPAFPASTPQPCHAD
jgi:hypothetical protein